MHKAKLFSCCIVLTKIFHSFAYFSQIVYLKFLLTCCTALPVAGSIRTNGEALVFTTIIAITAISTNCKELLAILHFTGTEGNYIDIYINN